MKSWCSLFSRNSGVPAGSIRTKEGVTHCVMGDYIVLNDDGSDEYAVAAAKFESLYERADQDS